MTDDERRRVAYHEGGRTILGLVVSGADPVNRLTITPRGQALGVTYQRPEADRRNYHARYPRARITGALGGRAAEESVHGSRTTGSGSDMEQATNLARQMVTRWGMSETTSQLVDDDVRRILDECYDDAVRLLQEHRQQLERLAKALLDRETLDEQENLAVTGLPRAPRLETLPIPADRDGRVAGPPLGMPLGGHAS